MKIASIANVKTRFSQYIKASEDELVVITRNGKPVAVLLSVDEDDDLERLALAHSRQFRAIVKAAMERVKATGGIPHDQFWQELEVEMTTT